MHPNSLAALAAVEPTLSAQHDQLDAIFAEIGPSTTNEVCRSWIERFGASKREHRTVPFAARISEMVVRDMIESCGSRVDPITGRVNTVWRRTGRPPKQLVRPQSIAKRLAAAQLRIVELEAEVAVLRERSAA